MFTRIHSKHISNCILYAQDFLRLGKQKGTYQTQTYFSAYVGKQVMNIVIKQTNK